MGFTSENKPEKQITMGILAHVDAGKTTLSEGILYTCKAIRKLGRVDHQDAFLDTNTLERNRGITIFSKQAECTLGEFGMTFLDTPGHVDFSAEMERTLQILDYAILVISGADGVQGHTETLWRLLSRYQIPVFLFINKMDQEGTDRGKLLFEVQNRNGILEEKDRRLYEYAYGVLLGRVVIYLIIVILGIITGNWMEMIVFLLPFTVLRQYAGGIHLEKAGGCMAVSGILVLLCSLYLASAPAVIWQMRIIWFVAVGVIFIMAPVDASSKKLDAKEKKVYGMRARVILVIECAIAGVFSVIGYSLIVNGIMVAHIVLASGLILGWTKIFFDKELE